MKEGNKQGMGELEREVNNFYCKGDFFPFHVVNLFVSNKWTWEQKVFTHTHTHTHHLFYLNPSSLPAMWFSFKLVYFIFHGLPWWHSGKESTYQCRRFKFDPWVGKLPWIRKWQLTAVFLLGNPMDGGAWWAIVHGVTRVGQKLATKQQPTLLLSIVVISMPTNVMIG